MDFFVAQENVLQPLC